MKIAIILHGNLRTFFMPTREHPNLRVCDIIKQNIIEPNDADIFISTDTNDFYYNDCQYFQNTTIDIAHGDVFRLYTKVGFMSPNEGKKIITKELQSLFGSRIKGMIINDTQEDLTQDPKFKLLEASGAIGASSFMLTGQYKKLSYCYKMIEEYEKSHNVNYDVIMKTRFDTMYNFNQKLYINSKDFIQTDAYIPGIKGPLIHDFYGFGNKKAMNIYLNIYDKLGCTINYQTYVLECRRDGNIIYFGGDPKNKDNLCQHCHKNDMVYWGDITLGSEFHLYHLFEKHKIKYKWAGMHCWIYRYKDVIYNNTIDNIINNELKLTGITVVNHSFAANRADAKKY